MPTTNYGLPTISSGDRLDGVSAINGLANAVDTALKQVADATSGGGEAYTLPPATNVRLGGVKISSGLTVLADGTVYVDTVWLTQQINSTIADSLTQQISTAVSNYMSEHYGTGYTWGDIQTNGFTYPEEG